MTTSIRQAVDSDLPTVVELWNAAQKWLSEIGQDQWQYPVKTDGICSAIADKTCWLVQDGVGSVLATVTLDDYADPKLWTPDDVPTDAAYLHRLVVRSGARGEGLGSAILDWASKEAMRAGKTWVRLDAWTNNTKLHDYYRHMGFEAVRVVNAGGVQSGALFQRLAGVTRGEGPAISYRSAGETGVYETAANTAIKELKAGDSVSG